MDCLGERDVCQLGATAIGKWIITEMEMKAGVVVVVFT